MGDSKQHREVVIRSQFERGRVLVSRALPAGGHEICSVYVDLFWTPVVGPSVVALLRWAHWRLTTLVHDVDGAEICEALGRMNPGRACDTAVRAVQFHCAELVERDGLDVIQFRSTLPTLSPQRLEQLSGHLRAMHEASGALL